MRTWADRQSVPRPRRDPTTSRRRRQRERQGGDRSGPVSRVLFQPDSRRAGDGHFSRRPVARPLKRSTRESMADRTSPRARPEAQGHRSTPCSLFDLAPGGVCLAKPVTRPAGELLPHRFTLTARARGPRGGLLSVALSLASRPVGVTHHRVLRSPDFPLAGVPVGPMWQPWKPRPAAIRSTAVPSIHDKRGDEAWEEG